MLTFELGNLPFRIAKLKTSLCCCQHRRHDWHNCLDKLEIVGVHVQVFILYDGDMHRKPFAVACEQLARHHDYQVGRSCARHCGQIVETLAPSRLEQAAVCVCVCTCTALVRAFEIVCGWPVERRVTFCCMCISSFL